MAQENSELINMKIRNNEQNWQHVPEDLNNKQLHKNENPFVSWYYKCRTLQAANLMHIIRVFY
jgi:hypothetical protein